MLVPGRVEPLNHQKGDYFLKILLLTYIVFNISRVELEASFLWPFKNIIL